MRFFYIVIIFYASLSVASIICMGRYRLIFLDRSRYNRLLELSVIPKGVFDVRKLLFILSGAMNEILANEIRTQRSQY